MAALIVSAEQDQFYQGLLDHQLGEVKAGRFYSWHRYSEKDYQQLEVDKGDQSAVYNALGIRSKWFLREIHSRLCRLSKKEPDVFVRLATIASDDLLRGIFGWLVQNGGIRGVKWNTFLAKFDPLEYVWDRKLPSLGRTLVVLSLLLEDPALIDRIDPQTERLPHRLFMDPVKGPTKLRLFKLCDQEIADAILEFVDDKFEAEISFISEYAGWGSGGSLQRGRYQMTPLYGDSNNLNVHWQFEDGDETSLQALTSKLAALDHKRVYATLSDILRMRALTFNDKGLIELSDKLDRRSLFFMSKTLYQIIRMTVYDYAFNQFFVPWKESGGKVLTTPHLAFKLGLSASLKDARTLKIVDHRKGVVEAPIDSAPRNTSRFLPLCVLLLMKFVSLAKEIQTTAHA